LLGSRDVYFAAPPSTGMAYPCIVYERDDARTEFAGNRPYTFQWRYQVTLIDAKPENSALAKLAALPLCSYSRHFVANKQNHDVFVLYF
jgi:hypothetical protein